jgi:hypothetical protein
MKGSGLDSITTDRRARRTATSIPLRGLLSYVDVCNDIYHVGRAHLIGIMCVNAVAP